MTTGLTTKNEHQTEQLLKNIRKTPLFRQLIPQEAGIGFPIPLRRKDKVFAIIPCYGFTPTTEKGKTILFPPFATITVNWKNQVPVEYSNLLFRKDEPGREWVGLQWEGKIGTFPHDALVQMTRNEYLQKRIQLLKMYDNMFSNLEEKRAFSSEWEASFKELLSLLIEPALIPYYRVLGSKFCDRFLQT